jgi:hypothetical protein
LDNRGLYQLVFEYGVARGKMQRTEEKEREATLRYLILESRTVLLGSLR